MTGGAGNDSYVVDVATDVLVEAAGGGDDLVKSAATWTLAAEFEYLTLTGSTAINGTGNALANILTGNGTENTLSGAGGDDTLRGAGGADSLVGGGGNDSIIGGAGIDTLNGGAGNDLFVFNALGDCGDQINGFVSADDLIRIDASAFGGGLTAGTAAKFRVRTADHTAQNATDRFIFQTSDNSLWFDADGNGAGVARKVADFQAGVTMVAGDIILF